MSTNPIVLFLHVSGAMRISDPILLGTLQTVAALLLGIVFLGQK